MNSPRSNHLGNPLITSTSSVGSKKSIDLQLQLQFKAPNSPDRSTFSKNDLQKPNLPQLPHTRGTIAIRTNSSPILNDNQRYTLSPNPSFTEREPLSTSSQGDCLYMPQHTQQEETGVLVGSTITTASSTIGLPSHYPGSVGHNRVGSLGSSILMEELQDFDDIFGQTLSHSSDHSLNYTDNENDVSNKDNRRGSLPPRNQASYYDDDDDDDDDLNALSRSMPFRLTLRQHRRNVSELSYTSIDIPSTVVTNSLKDQQQIRSSVTSTSSVCSTNSNNQRPSSIRSTSTTRSHRRSRAFSSTEFQKAVLEELEC